MKITKIFITWINLISLVFLGTTNLFAQSDPELRLILNDMNPQTGATFGGSLCDIGDVNGDGIADIAVGANGQDFNGYADTGQTTIFSGSDGSPIYIIDHPNPQANAFFGFAIAALGDVDGDFVPDMAISAYGQDVGGRVDQGEVYIFSGVDGSLIYTLAHPFAQSNAFFGHSGLVGLGDINGDDMPDLVVAASIQDVDGIRDVGQAYAFSGADWSLIYIADNPSPQAFSQYGLDIGLLGDVDGDGFRDFAVGAQFQDVNEYTDQGRGYVFSGATGSLLYILEDPHPQYDARFGDRIVCLGDINQDGLPDILVGTGFQNVDGNVHEGQGFVFSGADGAYLYSVNNPVPQAHALFGRSITGLGDLSGDGIPDFAIGAFYQDVDGNTDQGELFVFSGRNGQHLLTLSHPFPQAGAEYSTELTELGGLGLGTKIAVAARKQNVGGNNDQGQVYVYTISIPANFVLFPPVINLNSRRKYLLGRIGLPPTYQPIEIIDESISLSIPDCVDCNNIDLEFGLPFLRQYFTFFSRENLINVIETLDPDLPTLLDIQVNGELMSGTLFEGVDTISVFRTRRPTH